MDIPHPYYPVEAILVDYIANDWSVLFILGVFGAMIGVVVLGTMATINAVYPAMQKTDRLLTIWFMVSGLIHLVIEGYFSINHNRMPAMQDYLGQGWKEYSRSDSRYLTVDSFVVCMETVTAFAWGPLCVVIAGLIITGSPWRHPIQALVSTGQLYGDILYYSTNIFEYYRTGVSYSQPDLLVYVGYFVGMNAVWIVIPLYCIAQSMTETKQAFVNANVKWLPPAQINQRIDIGEGLKPRHH